VFPWLRLFGVGLSVIGKSKVDLLATTRIRLRAWPKWGFIEHRFTRTSRVIGVVAIRGVSKGPGGTIDPDVLLAGLAHTAAPPRLPEWATRFHRADELLSELLRDEERSKSLHQQPDA
jgi:hypothetical protein